MKKKFVSRADAEAAWHNFTTYYAGKYPAEAQADYTRISNRYLEYLELVDPQNEVDPAECGYEVPEYAASKIALLASPHYHALMKAAEIRQVFGTSTRGQSDGS